jgi:hypothetical protein
LPCVNCRTVTAIEGRSDPCTLHLLDSRRIVMRSLVVLTIGCLISSAAFAQPSSSGSGSSSVVTHVQTAADLAAVCDPSWSGVPRLEAIAYCQGFLTAAGQYHTLLHPTGGRARPLYCATEKGPTIAESGISFAAWLRSNPSHNAEPALDGFLRWAQVSLPCPSTETKTPNARPTR